MSVKKNLVLSHIPFRRSNPVILWKRIMRISLHFRIFLIFSKPYNHGKDRKKKSTINRFFASFYKDHAAKYQNHNSKGFSCNIPDAQNLLFHGLTETIAITFILQQL
jgi:hypothetical protein